MANTINLGDRVIFTPRGANLHLLETREAWVIRFDGFEAFLFRLYKMDGCWAIAEMLTGLPIVRGMGSKYEANDKAIVVLNARGVDATKKAIESTLERIADSRDERITGILAVTA